MASKNNPPKPNGRPPLPKMTQRQSVMRTKLLNVVEPYFKAALKEVARIGGLKVDKEETNLVIEDTGTDVKKSEAVSANTRLAACKVITDMYQSGLKEVYLKDDTTEASKEDEPKDKPKLASVHTLQLTVPVSEE